MTTTTITAWQKSTHSGGEHTDCVETAVVNGRDEIERD